MKYGLLATDDNQIYFAIEIDGKVIMITCAAATVTGGTWVSEPVGVVVR